MGERKYYLLAMLIRELYSLSMNSMDQGIGGRGITPQQMIVIKMIAHKGYTFNSELVSEMNLSKGTVSGIVKRLTKKGLIEKQVDEKDKRSVRLVFTEEGRRFADSIRWDMNTAFANMFGDSSDKEIENYLVVLREMSEKMKCVSIDSCNTSM